MSTSQVDSTDFAGIVTWKDDAVTQTIIEAGDLQHLFDALDRRGYQLLGPRLRDGAIIYDEIDSVSDLPVGWTDEQDGGTYRVKRRDDTAFFGYTVGPQSWKKYLHPPVVRLWHATRGEEGVTVHDDTPSPTKRAFIGVRACELSAIAIQDRVFMGEAYVDSQYAARRAGTFIVAVNCGKAGATCFCASMGTGPKAGKGFDISLTEVLHADRHYFVVEAGSQEGTDVLDEVPSSHASPEEVGRAEHVVADTAMQMGRTLQTEGLKALLYANAESPQWQKIAERCLTCGNCTMVCPTCFCTTVEDVSDLAGQEAERVRKWDSCFTMDFSYIHGGSVRVSPKSRYRQWMTHKLASWQDQFGTLGCVGCGRCITWCPVGIDITEEAAKMREG
ncbi:MAG: 4Fe-4S dicluster domain-containing protein [Chloroflexota bacterium]